MTKSATATPIHTPYGPDHPTSLPAAEVTREHVHQRQITVNGFVRSDGLYDIEAELTDHKTYSFPSDFRGTVTPDMPVHHMILRITMTDQRVITAAKVITVSGPYAVCPQANDVFDALVGLQIGPGWRKTVQAAIGGKHGCTHISELMGPVATIAYQTLYGQQVRERRETGSFSDAAKQQQRRHLLNSCVGYAEDNL
jgi:hypothetical protein